MPLLQEFRILDNLKVITEGTGTNKKLKVKGKFQKCDEVNNNGRTYPRKVLESQVKDIQSKISERSLVGALDHPPNDVIHLSQASHLITKLWVEGNGDVMGEAEILSTPSGKIVEALLNDNVKIGISSRGMGTVSESKNGRVVNDDFRLITFDLVSDPSTKGAYTELTESVKLNSKKAQEIVKKVKSEQIFLTLLKDKLNNVLEEGLVKKANKAKKNALQASSGRKINKGPSLPDDLAKSVHRGENFSDRNPVYKTVGNTSLTHRARKLTHQLKRNKKTKGKFTESEVYQRLASLIEKKNLTYVSGVDDGKGKFGQHNNRRLNTKRLRNINSKKVETYERLGNIIEGSLGQKRTSRLLKAYDKTPVGDPTRKQKFNKFASNIDKRRAKANYLKKDQNLSGLVKSFNSDRSNHNSKRGVKTKGKFTESKELTQLKESLSRIEEGNSTDKDKLCLKKFLISRITDLRYSYPWEPSKSTKVKSDKDFVEEDIDMLKRLINAIDSI